VVADRIIHGVCHDLNGRANSLSNLAYLVTSEGSAWEEVGSVVEEEVARLEETVRLLRRLPDDGLEPGLLAPREFLVLLPRLVRIQPGLELLETVGAISRDMPALRMDETFFTRISLLLLSGAGEAAIARGTSTVRMESGQDPRVLRIGPSRSSDTGLSGGGASGPRTALPIEMETRVGGVLRAIGGALIAVELGAGERGWEVRFPGSGG
jgi:hypothetical protein